MWNQGQERKWIKTEIFRTVSPGKLTFILMTGAVIVLCLLVFQVKVQAATGKINFDAVYFDERYEDFGAEAVEDTSAAELNTDFLVYDLIDETFTSVKSMDTNIVTVEESEMEGCWYLRPKASGMTTLICQEDGKTTGLYEVRVTAGFQTRLLKAQKAHENAFLAAERLMSASSSEQEDPDAINAAQTEQTEWERFAARCQLNTVNYGDTKLTGKAYKGTAVKITISGFKSFNVKVGTNGTFTVKGISGVKAGPHPA